ncbi:MAG: ABC transporter permease [Nitrospinota bacterium]|nr:MAG: ABC transporter permease [Nitrospinota bacterium]
MAAFLFTFLTYIGNQVLKCLAEMGRMAIFLLATLWGIVSPPFRFRQLLTQIQFVGTKSLSIIVLTAAFTGMVLGLQGYYTLRKFGSESVLGSLVALSLIRELGPVLAALMVTARAGSAMAAEIGAMRISEQIDALEVMAVNPIKYLASPRLLAAIIAVPLLTGLFDVVGIYGGYLVGVKLLGANPGAYFSSMEYDVVLKDISTGVIKALSFGGIVSWVCCYKGFYAGHGAEGVGRATTEAVVLSSVLILVWDYFITSLMI